MTDEKKQVNLTTMGAVVGAVINGLGYQPHRMLIVVATKERIVQSTYQVDYATTLPTVISPIAASLARQGADQVTIIGFEEEEDESLPVAAAFVAALDECGVRIPDNYHMLTVRKGLVRRPLDDGNYPPEEVDYSQHPFPTQTGAVGIAPSRSALQAQWQSVIWEQEEYPISTDPGDGRVQAGATAWAKACRGEDLTPIERADAASAVNNPLFRTALTLRLAPGSLLVALITEQMREYAAAIDVPGDKDSRVTGMRLLAINLPDVAEASNTLTVIAHFLWWNYSLDPALALLGRIERFNNPAARMLQGMIYNGVTPSMVEEMVAKAAEEREE